MTEQSEAVRNLVREHYAKIAQSEAACGCAPGCCSPDAPAKTSSLALGYSADDLARVPEGSDLGLGCGNPQAIAALKPGETVLDLGSGAGFDAFLAARQVGDTGRVLGVDMTPAMVTKARENARKVNANNVEFRLGEIENLPVADGSVDVILSNCVINLSPEKELVFREAARVLRPSGRLAITDVVLLKPLPRELCGSESLCGCVAGAATVEEITRLLKDVGFENVRVTPRPQSRELIRSWFPESGVEAYVSSATIEATKPASTRSCCGPSCCTPGARG